MNPFHAPPQQQVHTALKLRLVVLQIGSDGKITGRPQVGFNPAQDLSAIRVGNIKHNHTNGMAALAAQRPRK